jgi:hypothetical protein
MIVRSPVVLAAALAVLLALPGGTLAAKPFHENYDFTVTDEICGIPAELHSRGVVNETFTEDATGFRDAVEISGKDTWTAANGQSVTIQYAEHDVSVATEIAPNIVRFVVTRTGITNKIAAGGGPPTVARGYLQFVTVVDFTDPDNPVFLSQEIAVDHGSHPFAQGTLDFCDIVTAALT